MDTIYFATSNEGKFKEAKKHFEEAGLELERFEVELLEIQADTLEEVALFSVKEAFEKLKKPVFVEDGGLFVDALNGFPGVYSAPAYKTIGHEGILKLMQDKTAKEDRSASFQAVTVFTDGSNEKVFKGQCKGYLATEPKGDNGFGFDPIFIPEGHNLTFALDPDYKLRVSHRYNALQALINWLRIQ